MFIIYDPKKQRVPIKVWLENIVQLEYGCLNRQLTYQPFVNKWHLCQIPTRVWHAHMMACSRRRCDHSQCRWRGYWLWDGLCGDEY